MRINLYPPLVWLALLHVFVSGADFFAPYDYSAQNRMLPFAPPSRIHLIDETGGSQWRPFVCRLVSAPAGVATYEEDCSRIYPIRFFANRSTYSFWGLFEARRHLFDVESPAGVYLMGTDEFGRDQFSRFLHGGRISLFAATLACAISLIIASLFGAIAGLYGGWLDEIIMYFAELFLAQPTHSHAL